MPPQYAVLHLMSISVLWRYERDLPGSEARVVTDDNVGAGGVGAVGSIESAVVAINPVLLRNNLTIGGNGVEDLD